MSNCFESAAAAEGFFVAAETGIGDAVGGGGTDVERVHIGLIVSIMSENEVGKNVHRPCFVVARSIAPVYHLTYAGSCVVNERCRRIAPWMSEHKEVGRDNLYGGSHLLERHGQRIAAVVAVGFDDIVDACEVVGFFKLESFAECVVEVVAERRVEMRPEIGQLLQRIVVVILHAQALRREVGHHAGDFRSHRAVVNLGRQGEVERRGSKPAHEFDKKVVNVFERLGLAVGNLAERSRKRTIPLAVFHPSDDTQARRVFVVVADSESERRRTAGVERDKSLGAEHRKRLGK